MTNVESNLIFSLEDPINDLKRYAERLDCVLDDLTNRYFEHLDPNNKDDAVLIVSGFKKNAARADIVLDCFCHMLGQIDIIAHCLGKAIAEQKAEQAREGITQAGLNKLA